MIELIQNKIRPELTAKENESVAVSCDKFTDAHSVIPRKTGRSHGVNKLNLP